MNENVLNAILNLFTDVYLNYCPLENEAICKEALRSLFDKNKSKNDFQIESIKNDLAITYLKNIVEISNIKAVYCLNRTLGCRDIMSFHDKQNHLKNNCLFNTVYCEICELNYIKGENTCPNCVYLKNIKNT
jgi:hypothetical protein